MDNTPHGVTALALRGSKLYVGGSFKQIGGRRVRGLAALNSRTGRASRWNPAPRRGTSRRPRSAGIHAIATFGNAVFVGGDFTWVGGSPRSALAALSPTTGRAIAGWDPKITGGTNSGVWSIVPYKAQNGYADRVYIGGRFSKIDGVPRRSFGAIYVRGGNDVGFDPGVSGESMASTENLSLLGDKLYFNGGFQNLGAFERDRLAAVGLAGDVTPWNPNRSERCTDTKHLAVSPRAAYIAARPLASCGGGTDIIRVVDLDRGDMVRSPFPAPGCVQTLEATTSTIAVGLLPRQTSC